MPTSYQKLANAAKRPVLPVRDVVLRYQSFTEYGLAALVPKLIILLAWSIFCGCSSSDKMGERQGPAAGEIGASCVTNDNCDGGSCRQSWSGGYCTSRCQVDTDCGSVDAFCVPSVDGGFCADQCESDQECRPNYRCVKSIAGPTACVDPADLIAANPRSSEWLQHAGDADCDPQARDGLWAFPITIPSGGSFFFTLYTTDGTVEPISLHSSNGILEFNDYPHHSSDARPILFNDGDPAITDYRTYGVPYADAFSGAVSEGEYTLVTRATGQKPCLSVQPSNANGTELAVNLYLVVGSEEIEDDLNAALEIAAGTLRQAGFELIYTAKPFPEDLRARYLRPRSGDVDALTALGAPANGLSIDLFVVDDLDGRLGISGRLPGAPGMHGQFGNGVVVSAVDLGADNRAFGLTVAHEIAHFVGLTHTTEGDHGTPAGNQLPFSVDAIADTPECPSPSSLGNACPDSDNLMFPFLGSGSENSGALTDEQVRAIRVNPLIQ